MPKEGKKKNILQDVIPPKRSIRDISLPSSRSKPVRKTKEIREKPLDFIEETSVYEDVTAQTDYTPHHTPKNKKIFRKRKWITGFIVLVIFLFGISILFKSAKVTITPKTDNQVINISLTAKKNPVLGELGFQVVTVTKSVEKIVPAGSEQQVEKKAKGTIIVYNNYSTKPQKLLINTRFATPEGLVFYSTTPVTIPGQHVTSGKTVAGSVEVGVVAAEAGEKYNIPLKDFTVVGFKGTLKYTKIYARSKTEMVGGFSGKQKVVAEEVFSLANAQLEDLLRPALQKELALQIPDGFVLYDSSISYDMGSVSQTGVTENGAILRKTGTARAVILNRDALTQAVLLKTDATLSVGTVKVANLDKLDFAYTGKFGFVDANSVSFSLKGTGNFVWLVDIEKMKSELLGLSKKDAGTVIASYRGVGEAWVETHPFWNTSIPSDSTKVTIINTNQ